MEGAVQKGRCSLTLRPLRFSGLFSRHPLKMLLYGCLKLSEHLQALSMFWLLHTVWFAFPKYASLFLVPCALQMHSASSLKPRTPAFPMRRSAGPATFTDFFLPLVDELSLALMESDWSSLRGLQTEMPLPFHREQILLLKTHTPAPALSEEEQNKAGVIFPSQRLQRQLIHTRTGSQRTQTDTSDVTVAPRQILWQRQWSIKWSSGGPKIKCIDSFESFRNTRKHQSRSKVGMYRVKYPVDTRKGESKGEWR